LPALAGPAALRQHSNGANRRLDLSQFKNRDQLLQFVGQRPNASLSIGNNLALLGQIALSDRRG
jgi:hypothetical protein